jgi:hypothetical protein
MDLPSATAEMTRRTVLAGKDRGPPLKPGSRPGIRTRIRRGPRRARGGPAGDSGLAGDVTSFTLRADRCNRGTLSDGSLSRSV